MTSREEIVIADDGLPMDKVGPWAKEKHERLRKYIDISRGARRMFLNGRPEKGIRPGGATYIDLFCGYGRSKIRDTNDEVDGSPLVAFKSASSTHTEFSEIHLGDADQSRVDAATTRLKAAGGTSITYVGEAAEVARKVASSLNPHGLHFVFLDPYNLLSLSFSVIEAFSRFRYIDMLIHVSAQDLTRNLQRYIAENHEALEAFAPGWRDHVSIKQSGVGIRAELFDYWRQKIAALGIFPDVRADVVTGTKNQRLYWLVFASRHDLARRFWNEVRDVSKQRTLL